MVVLVGGDAYHEQDYPVLHTFAAQHRSTLWNARISLMQDFFGCRNWIDAEIESMPELDSCRDWIDAGIGLMPELD